MARVLDTVTMPIKKNGTKTPQEYVNNPKSTAPQFSALVAYAAGQIVFNEKKLYRFKTAHPAGAWNAAHVEEITVASELVSHGTDISELKADLTAVETDIETGNLTAGTAKQLLSDNGMTDKSPYLFRAMPTGAGDREEPVIVGGSVVWNQLANFSPSSIPSASKGITYSSVDGKSVTFSGTADDAENRTGWFGISDVYFSTRVGHNILFLPKIISGSFENGTIKYALFATPPLDFSTPTIKKVGATTQSQRIATNVTSGTVANDFTVTFICIDLTQMFGTTIADYIYSLEQATAGAGVAWFRKLFTQDYYPFCEPTFKHVEGLTAHKMVGFNQWDEEWENGLYIITTGVKDNSNNHICCKNPVAVTPNTNYFFNTSGYNINVCFMDENMGFIKNFNGVHDVIRTTPSNCRYIVFNMAQAYGTTYNHDICINLSDPAKNGTYEPYKEYTYPLDTDVVLRGFPKLDSNNNLYFDGDVRKADGTVTRRYDIVDLGTLNWSYSSAYTRLQASVPGMKYVNNATVPNIRCVKYQTLNAQTFDASTTTTGIMAVDNGTNILYIRDLDYTTGSSFKTAMDGVMLLFEKVTPTEETATPYAPLQLADPYGTEEWVLDDEAFPMPVGQETFYPENLRAKIEGLPWNFANLIAPTETTNTATRNYTAGNLLIVNNILYKVTVNIANGGTITPGTNVTATTLAEIISALQ